MLHDSIQTKNQVVKWIREYFDKHAPNAYPV